MVARYGPAAGYSQLMLGFGIGTINGSAASGLGKLDFSRAANSAPIVVLRRF